MMASWSRDGAAQNGYEWSSLGGLCAVGAIATAVSSGLMLARSNNSRGYARAIAIAWAFFAVFLVGADARSLKLLGDGTVVLVALSVVPAFALRRP
jgi:hypothetical protein